MQTQSVVYLDSSMKEFVTSECMQMRTSLSSQEAFSRSCDHGCKCISGFASTPYIRAPCWLPKFLPHSSCKNQRITGRSQFEDSTILRDVVLGNKICGLEFCGAGNQPVTKCQSHRGLYPWQQK